MIEASFQHAVAKPDVDRDSSWWWADLARGRLTLPTCEKCGRARFPPRPVCPRCGNEGFASVVASGRGRVYSWVVIHRGLDPAFASDAPYTIVAIDLEEGVRMFGRLADVQRAVTAGADVRAVIYEVAGVHLVGFELT